MRYEEKIAHELKLRPKQVAAAIELLDGGNTIPFVARYRQEATGGLDEEALRQAADWLARLRALDERRATILATIVGQEKLTPELAAQIAAAETLTVLEDLYLPYKPRRRTRASMAREKGLQPLADLILMQPRSGQPAAELAQRYVVGEVATVAEALAGARDIVAECISDHAGVRGALRTRALQWSVLQVEKVANAADEKGVYTLYYAYESRVDRLRPHQVLAINRGEAEKVLRVKLVIGEADWLLAVRQAFRPDRRSPLAEELQLAMEDAARRLLLPAIERDVRRALTEQAESHAIAVFAANLRGLLLQPPLAGHVVLGVDPGFRTGCKVAVIEATGKVLATATIYPHTGAGGREASLATLAQLLARFEVTLIAIGNGTASRETEQLVAELLGGMPPGRVQYLIVNEAGASVYSASPLARAEMPDLDVTLRGAVSIARRVQDPLAELVKIDPQSIGVGMYQHDVDQKQLAGALDGVVESVVNQVGVDVNTASPALLTRVAGIGPRLAERVVAYRDEQGAFADRQALHQVPGLGPKAFEQAAGFLRVREGREPLDSSAIHPESYGVARAVLARAGTRMTDAPAGRETALQALVAQVPLAQLAREVGTGVPTLSDILAQLARPGRDPREDAPPPMLRSDVLSMADLRPGMRLHGTVRNVVDFGAFVDIGVKQDGLLHRSQIPRGQTVQVGDVREVEIRSVDAERGRISLGW